MRHRHTNNRHTFGMLLNRPAAVSATGQAAQSVHTAQVTSAQCVPVETAKRRHALMHGVPSSYWRLRHHHGYVMSRPM
jgi:hypothetical protein